MKEYQKLISAKNLKSLNQEEALKCIGYLIDRSLDLKKKDGLNKATIFAKQLEPRLAQKQLATLNYFRANIWANKRSLSYEENRKTPNWEQRELEKEIFYLRLALNGELPKERKLQAQNNLANLFKGTGRDVEAIEYYDKALETLPAFNIANLNKGVCLADYGRFYSYPIQGQDQAALFLKFSYNNLRKAEKSNLDNKAESLLNKYKNWIESKINPNYLNEDIELNNFGLGSSKQEIQYRKWCLENRLFLNYLNDLGPFGFAAEDDLRISSVVVRIDEGPYFHGCNSRPLVKLCCYFFFSSLIPEIIPPTICP